MKQVTEPAPLVRTLFYVLKDIQYNVRASRWQEQGKTGGHFTIWVITGGSGTIDIGGNRLPLGRGTCCLAVPDAAVELTADEDGLIYYRVSFEPWSVCGAGSGSGTGQNEPSGGGFPFQGEALCHPFSTCMDYLESIYRHRDSDDDLEQLDNHVRFQEWMRFLLAQNRSSGYEGNMRKAVEQSIELIKEQYRDVWTVNALADRANVARWQYSRLFKELTGQIPLDYLNGVRIDRAKKLLLTTDDRLYDIAQNVGFSNEYYFNRRFKQTLGISPGQYRRHYREHARVFAPFLEDFLVALGITPVVECSHRGWGRQEYLGLHDVPVLDLAEEDEDDLSRHRPDFIMLDSGFDKWIPNDRLGRLAPTFHMPHPGEDWRSTLHKAARLLGRTDRVEEVIRHYEQKARDARSVLGRSTRGQTVAFLRISALGISLYAGPDYGYTGPVLYKDLGLAPHSLVMEMEQETRKMTLPPEWLERLDADHLFITFDRRHSSVPGEERAMLETASWQALPAVKKRCVYEVDFMTWMNYGVISNSKKIDDVLKVLA